MSAFSLTKAEPESLVFWKVAMSTYFVSTYTCICIPCIFHYCYSCVGE